jgi:hypothetical protein
MKNYELVKKHPVAKFFYKGNHSHPVRRIVLLTETTGTYIRGYELREGLKARTFKGAPIKTYTKNKIARLKEVDPRRRIRRLADGKGLNKSTLTRAPLVLLVKEGV